MLFHDFLVEVNTKQRNSKFEKEFAVTLRERHVPIAKCKLARYMIHSHRRDIESPVK